MNKQGVPIAAAALAAFLVFLYNRRSGSKKGAAPQASTDTKDSGIVRAKFFYPKPKDGAVRVSELYIHPIKSCRGTPVETAKYNIEGFEHDRQWCIMDVAANRIITAREFPKMVLIVPRIEFDTTAPHKGLIHVTFPENSDCTPFTIPLQPTKDILSNWEILENVTLWPTHDPLDGYIGRSLSGPADTPSTVLSKYFGKSVHLIYKGPRARPIDTTPDFPNLKATAWFQDMYPMMVLSEESMADVNQETKGRVGMQGITESWKEDNVVIRRFRPNVIFSGGGSFAEDNWETIRIGSKGAPNITLVSKCARCLLPNVSPDTGEADKAVPYKVLMKFRTGLDPANKLSPCVGCNGVPDREGVIKVGDVVYVQKMWEEPQA
ncbi:MOSC N-terminal beta barrel domain-containing protein [Collybia nuda]|uniref:MOSC N-terminal beta barrel domain-containing protein n=1 Tax=Collybia nuda TaxID=64659 RepID=A0A9P6CRG7_9AGAR|nr:MOSC N-terminal beta barrel domain-containing protein [Collybia nuda]